MSIRTSTWGSAVLLLASGVAAAAGDFRILHVESLDLRAEDLPSLSVARTAHAPVSFQAHGRQFDLELEANERLLSRLPAAQIAALRRYPLYRGRIQGTPDSWVRLTRIGHALHGMIWDGRELYVIEPEQLAARFMLAPAAGPRRPNVVYRLSDTQSDLGPQFCTVLAPGAAASPLAAYRSLVGELQQGAAHAAALGAPTGEMQVGVVGDFEFSTDHPGGAQGVALARMNSVDGIFSDQVGVRLAIHSVKIFETAADPFTQSDPKALLNEVGAYKNDSANGVRGTGVAHLMTGRRLDGQTIGIAFLGAVCNPQFGVSLSMGGLEISAPNAVLVAAHEIGHNFGAPHDAETDPAQDQSCAGAPTGFLMEARLNGSNQFSQCSLDEMRPVIDAAQCVTPLDFSDAELTLAPAAASVPIDQDFAYSVLVSSAGSLQVDAVTVTITLPALLALQSVTSSAGSCSSGAGAVTCDLGNLPGGSSHTIGLTVRGSQAGSFVSTATVSAANDADARNNSATLSLTVAPPSPPSGGGGGGALGGVLLLGLLVACARKMGTFLISH